MPKKSFTGFIDHQNRVINPISLEDFNFILQSFSHRDKVTITVESFVRDRSLSQSGLFHKYVAIIANETGNDNDTVKKEMKKRFGVIKDDGNLKSTSNYTTEEMAKLIDGTWTFAVTDLGINIPTPEDFKTKNIK